jgi:hypothetical protein
MIFNKGLECMVHALSLGNTELMATDLRIITYFLR